MGKCEFCGQKVVLPFQCSFCKAYFCYEHLHPKNHMCAYATRNHMVNEATFSEILLDSFLFVAMMVAYAFVIALAVLAVDAVVLLLLNLWSVDTWLTLLLLEGVVMGLLGGVAGLLHHGAPVPWATPMGTRLYRIEWAVRKPLFWASVGIAGLMLIVFAYFIWITS